MRVRLTVLTFTNNVYIYINNDLHMCQPSSAQAITPIFEFAGEYKSLCIFAYEIDKSGKQ